MNRKPHCRFCDKPFHPKGIYVHEHRCKSRPLTPPVATQVAARTENTEASLGTLFSPYMDFVDALERFHVALRKKLDAFADVFKN